MRHPITTTTLALLLSAGASTAALAQDRGDRGPGGQPQMSRGDGAGRGDRGQGAAQGQWNGGGRSQRESQPQPQYQAAPQAAPVTPRAEPEQRASRATVAEDFRRQRDAREGQPQAYGGGDQRRNDSPRTQTYDRNPRDGGQQWDRGSRDNNRQPNGWNGRNDQAGRQQWERGRFPPVYRSAERYRIDRYRAPSGYYARQWGYGDVLPRSWFGAQYYIGDFFDYGLPYPPPGFEWVRVGEDALLVDRFSGRIVQVVRYLFW